MDGHKRIRTAKGEGHMMYAWKCSSCHHEWMGPDRYNIKCAWCGGEPVLLGPDKSYLPSEMYKKLSGGMKGI